ncbi:hypothetical protein EDB89DRAFT_2050441 [Lactarius sanguifluus]|nr:hypothetical protein EDB89DRAFT_2050441 [Lactarius sanguifluus]
MSSTLRRPLPLLFVVLGSFVSPRPFVPYRLFNSIVSAFRLSAPYATCFLPPLPSLYLPLLTSYCQWLARSYSSTCI